MAAGDAKELKRLQRITDPKAVWGQYRELESKFSQGGLVKIPGPKATDEEKAAFRKAVGVPEKPDDYLGKLTLPEGKVLGDADKPLAESFVKALHPAGATPEVVSAAINWYQDFQEQQASDQFNADEDFRSQSRQALETDWGPSMGRNIAAISTVFSAVPGGADIADRILTGRTSDGRLIGDDPAITKWLAGLALEINPLATVVPASADQLKAVGDRLAELRKLSGKDGSEYWNGPNAKKLQTEFAELLAANNKAKARAA